MLCGSNSQRQEQQWSLKIDKEIADERITKEGMISILLLGQSGSGKTTIFNKFKAIGGEPTSELLKCRDTIFLNTISQILILIDRCNKLSTPLLPENVPRCQIIKTRSNESAHWTSKDSEDLFHLWNDPAIKNVFEKRNQLQLELSNSAEYFFENLERISKEDYVPSVSDSQQLQKNKSINEVSVSFEGVDYKFIDINVQNSQIRKWIHCFNDILAVIFVVSLDDYDQYSQEEEVNKLDLSLDLYSETTNSMWLQRSGILLFFNKKDLFIEKLKTVPFSNYDAQYTGNNTFEETSAYLQNKFMAKTHKGYRSDNQIQSHFVNALDVSEIMRTVFTDTKEILLSKVMDLCGQSNTANMEN
ncbi:hypothetical protein CYY_007074 [Polysphondylium violaceum]|uniref:Uncharacterized protein n=1 Tax=Polysphondylium violaceum TaxID=133409 RepID=A0A8J4PQY7_9MYCE|nr:hypothetical protein CYY_007074 [Polysphondylium violaceum]